MKPQNWQKKQNGYEVKLLNEQVKRNITRFPEDFSKSQIATLNENGDRRGTNIKKLPFAFAEQGIYMLATVLRGELAKQQSIFIMRAFREMRHYIKQNQQFVTQSEMRLVMAKWGIVQLYRLPLYKVCLEIIVDNTRKLL